MSLITPQELQQYRDIGKKLDVDKVQESIDLAQATELYDILNDFLFDVIANADQPAYQDLMDGSDFTYEGEAYTQVGIKRLLGDLAYSRFVYAVNQNFTPFGATQKFSDNSQAIDRNIIKDMAMQAKRDADSKFMVIRIYLKANESTFSRFWAECDVRVKAHTQRWDII